MENDCEVGVTIAAVARRLGISNSAAGQRMAVLKRAGYARMVTAGRYRATTPEK